MKKVIIIVLVSILGLILLGFGINMIRINKDYKESIKNYKSAFNIPGRKDNYVPQGMAYDKSHNIVLQTSYNAKGKASKLYITDLSTKKLIKEIALKKSDGSDNTNHVGGVATNGETVWITSDYQANEYSLEKILSTTSKSVKSLKDSKLPIRGDFCYYDFNSLFIGDFFLKPFYPVPDDTPLLLGYYIKGLDYSHPKIAISLPKMVQGMAITKDYKFVFTRSYTYLVNSSLSVYKNVLYDKPDTYKINGKEIPYYHFDEKSFIKEENIPPMAEGIFYKDKEIYILFESDADHYKLAYPRINKVMKKVLK